ncbi:MAG TPA: hypothetical protein VM487_12820 [Phycisphaerae bacterium]|nr:hypothetical protein [Phycisphaerae bacterium]
MTEPGGDVWKIGAEWCDAHRIPYPPRCVGPCHRTFVRLKMDRVGLTYDRDKGPMCTECATQTGGMSMANIRWDECMSDQPLWSEAAELHDGGMSWDETAAELNRRYHLDCLGATVSQVVKRRRKRGKGGGDGDEDDPAAEGCSITVDLGEFGFYLRVEADTPGELRERITLGDSILAGGGDG